MSQPEYFDDDRPWTEAQWEAFMKRADARSAKFGELLETFQDHPNRDAIIDHEMGWDRRRAQGGDAFEDFLEEVSAAAEDAHSAAEGDDLLAVDDDWDLLDDELDEEDLDEEDLDEEDLDEEDLEDDFDEEAAEGEDQESQDEAAQRDAADYMARR